MQQLHIQYKGFTITNAVSNFYVNAVGFKEEGYASESAAKGAITKYLKQQEAKVNPEWTEEDQREQEYFDRWPDDIHLPQVINGIEINPPVTLGSLLRKEFAKMEPVVESRNKREGVYIGKTNGKHDRDIRQVFNFNGTVFSVRIEPKNRKQRKAAKLAHWKIVDKFLNKIYG